MSFAGIIESLIASAIWAGIAFFCYKVKKGFETESERYRSLFEKLRDMMLNDIEPSNAQDIYFMLNILSKRFMCKLYYLYNSRVILVIILLYCWTKIGDSKDSIGETITVLLYIILIIYESYAIDRIKDRIDDFDMAIMKGISARFKKITN
jgi:hypothetical protein